MMLFFLIVTPVILLIAWSIMLGKIHLALAENHDEISRARVAYLNSADNLPELFSRFVKLNLKERFVLVMASGK